jgi:hypothetical protein
MNVIAAMKLMYMSAEDITRLIGTWRNGNTRHVASLVDEILHDGARLYDLASHGRPFVHLAEEDLSLYTGNEAYPVHILSWTNLEAFDFIQRTKKRYSYENTLAFYNSIAEQLVALSAENAGKTVAAIVSLRGWYYVLVYRPGIGYFFFDSHQKQLDQRMLIPVGNKSENRGSMLMFSENIRPLIQTLINVNDRALAIVKKEYGSVDEFTLKQIIPGAGGHKISPVEDSNVGAMYLVPTKPVARVTRQAAPEVLTLVRAREFLEFANNDFKNAIAWARGVKEDAVADQLLLMSNSAAGPAVSIKSIAPEQLSDILRLHLNNRLDRYIALADSDLNTAVELARRNNDREAADELLKYLML